MKIIIRNLLLLVFCFSLFAKAQQNSKPFVPSSFKWDLKSIYDDSIPWESKIAQLKKENIQVSHLEGLIKEDYDNLYMVLERVSQLRGKVAKLVIYGALMENLDYTSVEAQQQFLEALEIEDEIEATTSFINYEIAKIPSNDIQKQILTQPKLAKHIKRINRIKEEAKFRLPKETEKALLGMKRLWLQSGQTYQALFENKNLDWPEVMLSNKERIKVFPRQFFNIRKSSNSKDRVNVSKTFLNSISKYKDILAIQLTKRIETELQIGKFRGFSSGIDAEFFIRDGFPVGTTSTFRDIAFKHRELLQKYCKIVAKLNGNKKPHYADVYAGTANIDREFSLQESIDIVYNSTHYLGDEYKSKIDSLLNENTFHFEMSKNKRIMWAIFPPVGGAKPYTIMPYNNTYRASSVLSRAIVGNLAQHHYKPDTRDDPPVYNNGIIYVGSLLHQDYLIKEAHNKEEKLAYLQAGIYSLYNTFFKYAVYASFEYEIEKRLQMGKSPNGEEVSNIYYGVLKNYYGKQIEIPKEYAYEWMTIAQPFNTYEHQYWPVAMAAACNILENIGEVQVKKLLIGKTNAKSDRSFQILKEAGIDMTKPHVYNSLIKKMYYYFDEMDKQFNIKK
ncbi:hypothetical protein BFR04_11890 [Gaetbulibacter sp. 4G1]|nr:hypothetical protein [Gaetbulibacter sp. 4G1]PIA81999.1 hypothetical protein BFR04_11890 [Gaetbulibacter sp. 4G1]